MKEKSLIAKIQHALKRRAPCIVPWVIYAEIAFRAGEGQADCVSRIAQKAGSDWLVDNETGEARFFEGN